MNINTGELRRFKKGEEIDSEVFKIVPEDLVPEVNNILGNDNSVTLPLDHPLRKEMYKRLSKKSTKKRKNRNKQ